MVAKTNLSQVYSVPHTFTRIQVGRPYHLSITRHVLVPARTKVGNSLRARIIVPQIHAQRQTDRFYAPWTRMGL
jgi:hypothetical protein